jgi:hypothetical protein
MIMTKTTSTMITTFSIHMLNIIPLLNRLLIKTMNQTVSKTYNRKLLFLAFQN